MQHDDMQSFAIVAIEALYFISSLGCSSGLDGLQSGGLCVSYTT